jgi:hypothetical protein
LHKNNDQSTLYIMKRWQVIALCAAVVAVAAYFYFYRGGFGLGSRSAATGDMAGAHAAKIQWQTISRPDEGFRLDMPADPKDLQVPAYNEMGGTEPVKMLFSSPDGDTTFAVTWQDNPPVARVNNRAPERTLDQARDGMLSRTQTTLVSESRLTSLPYPGRDITAKNSEGGFLDARLLYVNDRLYTLMALFPTQNARREQDVIRFFNSFSPLRVSPTLPEAAQKGT